MSLTSKKNGEQELKDKGGLDRNASLKDVVNHNLNPYLLWKNLTMFSLACSLFHSLMQLVELQ